MLDQLKEAMGEGQQPGQQPGQGEGEGEGQGEGQGEGGDSPGEGSGGTTDLANDKFQGDKGESGTRKLEKKAGNSAAKLPDEYRKVIDAYKKVELKKP